MSPPDANDSTAEMPAILEVFQKGAPQLPELLKGYTHRPQQERMAHSVAHALERSRSQGPRALLAEAGTGVGKTLAYLLPLLDFALRENTRVVVSTETKSLQSQLIEKDLKIAERLLGRGIKAEVCLGASNYVCKRKLSRVMQEGSFGPEMSGYTDELLDWESATATGLRSEYRGYASPQFWRKITRDSEDCLGSRCPNYEISYYFLAREEWRQARLLIVNHSLLASHFALEGRFLPEFGHLVVDEAHRFPEIYHRAFIQDASFAEIQTLCQDIGRRDVDAGSLFHEFRAGLVELLPLGKGAHQRRQSGLSGFTAGERFLEGLGRAGEMLRLRLEDMKSQQDLGFQPQSGDASASGDAGDESERTQQSVELVETQSMLNRLAKAQTLVRALLEGPGAEQVFWLSRENDVARGKAGQAGGEDSPADAASGDSIGKQQPNYRLHHAPLLPGRLFQQTFFRPELACAIFTSATLTSGGGRRADTFRYYAGEIGLAGQLDGARQTKAQSASDDDWGDERRDVPLPVPELLQLDSPFDYQERAILYLPGGMPDPSKEEQRFHEAAAREVERLLLLTRGGAFVLFTSTRSLRAVHAILGGSGAGGPSGRRYANDPDDRPAYEIFSQAELGAAGALHRFRESAKEQRNGALFGLATFWQGIDVPGDDLRLVVLVRLPFRVPDEPLLAARLEAERAAGRDAFGGLQLPAATLSMKQGFGRLIRTALDRGIVAMLDPRLQTKGYGRKILETLPPARRLRDFPEVAGAYQRLFH